MRLDANELGVILPDDNSARWTSDAPGFPLLYWNAAAALYAYEYGVLSGMGVDVVGMSQLVGYPSMNITRVDTGATQLLDPQYPSVAMLNWTTGEGTARFWALKLLIDTVRPFASDVVATTVSSATDVYAQAYAGRDGTASVLLVNKRHTPQSVQLPTECAGAEARVVDESTAFGPARADTVSASGALVLPPFAVCVVTLRVPV